MGMQDLSIVRTYFLVPTQEAAVALRPYVVAYCPTKQHDNLAVGKRVRLDIPGVSASLELYPHLFTHGKPKDVVKLRAIIAAAGKPFPVLKLSDETDIGWLFLEYTELALRRVNIVKVGDLTNKTEAELGELPGIGAVTVRRVKKQLAFHGLYLRPETD